MYRCPTLGISFPLGAGPAKANLNNLTTEFITIKTIKTNNNRFRVKNLEVLELMSGLTAGLLLKPRITLQRSSLTKLELITSMWQPDEALLKKSQEN